MLRLGLLLFFTKRATFVAHRVRGPGTASSRLHPHVIQAFVQETVHLLAYLREFLLVLRLRQGAVDPIKGLVHIRDLPAEFQGRQFHADDLLYTLGEIN
ncbi:MAG: hypothetical protein E5X61_18735 [Mesorhizobium sp.]|nr:MAG: hypothetical protein E5X61_18735 [Mesorhizobium sp.]